MGIQSLLFKVVILQTYTCDVVYMYYMMFICYDGKLFLSDVFSVHPRFAIEKVHLDDLNVYLDMLDT